MYSRRVLKLVSQLCSLFSSVYWIFISAVNLYFPGSLVFYWWKFSCIFPKVIHLSSFSLVLFNVSLHKYPLWSLASLFHGVSWLSSDSWCCAHLCIWDSTVASTHCSERREASAADQDGCLDNLLGVSSHLSSWLSRGLTSLFHSNPSTHSSHL